MEQLNKILSPDNDRWFRQYIDTHGRAPVILLIGNIANNGYNNAKLLSEAGFDCDVICYDYYHMMGCPEWEDADLSGRLNDDFRPNWTSMDLGGFERPEWFAQGPLKTCIDYLCARRDNAPTKSEHWRRLLIHSRCISPRNIKDLLTLLEPLMRQAYGSLINSLPRLLVRALSLLVRQAKKLFRRHSLTVVLDPAFQNRADALITEFVRRFPERSDKLQMDDVYPYCQMFQEWCRLFNHYDIIIGFATDPFLPMLSGRSYFAIEHGTLRTIPFDKNGQGRRTALAYNQAQHCFVTNFDCVDAANKLAPGRNTLINHPYNEEHGLSVVGVEALRARLLLELDCDFLLFHPTRQDWVHGTGYADKLNEVFLLAFGALRQSGLRVGLVICSWGSNVAQSRKLLADLGCSANIRWTSPMAITSFERMCKACDVVVDQFKLGAFGGVVFKAMAVGAPIVTYLNEALIARQYCEIPPVINCKTTADIEVAIAEFMKDPVKLDHIRQQSREWISRHHGNRETINKQVDQFRHHLPIPSDSTEAVGNRT
jgi:glycosyltransferase involved in cell wall biosynthesis